MNQVNLGNAEGEIVTKMSRKREFSQKKDSLAMNA